MGANPILVFFLYLFYAKKLFSALQSLHVMPVLIYEIFKKAVQVNPFAYFVQAHACQQLSKADNS